MSETVADGNNFCIVLKYKSIYKSSLFDLSLTTFNLLYNNQPKHQNINMITNYTYKYSLEFAVSPNSMFVTDKHCYKYNQNNNQMTNNKKRKQKSNE